MLKKGMTIREAAEHWVNGFNAIPLALIEKAYGGDNIDDLEEITPVSLGDHVFSYEHQEAGEVMSINREEETAVIRINDEDIEVDLDECIPERDSLLPMWGTMWTFGENIDEVWARENLEVMADCGFRIYESDELGIYFGIDGAGYDFYEAHWIPLYKARGLQWHEEDV